MNACSTTDNIVSMENLAAVPSSSTNALQVRVSASDLDIRKNRSKDIHASVMRRKSRVYLYVSFLSSLSLLLIKLFLLGNIQSGKHIQSPYV